MSIPFRLVENLWTIRGQIGPKVRGERQGATDKGLTRPPLRRNSHLQPSWSPHSPVGLNLGAGGPAWWLVNFELDDV